MALQMISEIHECKKCGLLFAKNRMNRCHLCQIKICEQCTNQISIKTICEDCIYIILEQTQVN
jgi:ribosomal protein L32